MNKRILNVLLVLVIMVACVLPFAASAAGTCAHTWEAIPAVAVTCTTDGSTAGSKCSSCGIYNVTPTVIASTGHYFNANHECTKSYCDFVCDHQGTMSVTVAAKDATCTAAAKTAEETCSVCGYVKAAEEYGRSNGHTFQNSKCTVCNYECKTHTLVTKVEAKPATCVTGEISAREECQGCDYVKEARAITDPLGHNYVENVTTKATCTADGLKTITCSRCSYRATEVIEAPGHRYSTAVGVTDSCKHCSYKCDHAGDLLVLTEEAKDATCTAAPYIPAAECSECNYTRAGAHQGVGLGHKWGTDGVCVREGCGATCQHPNTTRLNSVAPTCEATGLEGGMQCDDCKMIVSGRGVIDALGHTYNLGVVTKEATCEEAGVKTYTCKRENDGVRCTHSYTEPIAATGHTYYETQPHWCKVCDFKCQHEGDLLVVVDPAKDATCTKAPYIAGVECSKCNYTRKGEYQGVGLGHKWGTDGVCTVEGCGVSCEHPQKSRLYSVAPTCEATGLHGGLQCDDCKMIVSGRGVIDALGHTYNLGVVTKEATCEEAGVKTYTCKREIEGVRCTHSYTEPIAATGHTYYETQPHWCKVCDFKCQHEGDLLVLTEEAKDATCTAAPYIPAAECSKCNYTRKGAYQGVGLGHDFTVNEGYRSEEETATCQKTGIFVLKCSRCDERTAQVAPKVDHKFTVVSRVFREPSCEQTGWTEFKCTMCDSLEIREIEATGHTEETLDPVTATCTETGLREGKKCSVCDKILVEQIVIPAEGHLWMDIKGEPATCTEDGYTDYKQCDVCDAIEGYEEIKGGHDYNGVTCNRCGIADPQCEHENAIHKHTDSTCTDPGRDSFWCPDCNYEHMGEELPLAPHTIEVQVTAATCIAKGETREVCTVCQQVVKSIELPMADHSYEDGVCACGATDPDYVAPEASVRPGNSGSSSQRPSDSENGGSMSGTETTSCDHPAAQCTTRTQPATCVTSGYRVVTCNACGVTVVNQTIPATGHTEKTDTQAATCTKNGATVVSCSVCHVQLSHTVLPATGHTYKDGACTIPTCKAPDPSKYTTDFLPIFFVN